MVVVAGGVALEKGDTCMDGGVSVSGNSHLEEFNSISYLYACIHVCSMVTY